LFKATYAFLLPDALATFLTFGTQLVVHSFRLLLQIVNSLEQSILRVWTFRSRQKPNNTWPQLQNESVTGRAAFQEPHSKQFDEEALECQTEPGGQYFKPWSGVGHPDETI